MNRRKAVAAVPLGALAALGFGCSRDGDAGAPVAPESARKLETFGLQLSTITPLLMSDFEGTLAAVAAIGYRQVEFSALGFLGRPVSLVRELLTANGLSAPVGRISPRLPESFGALSPQEQRAEFRIYSGADHLLDNVRQSLEDCAVLGQKHLVLPALMPDNFSSLAQIRASIDLLRRAGELCASAGVQFGYHNHDWELRAVDGVIPYDLMLDKIEPELMSMQLDVYWVTRGGGDPISYLSASPGRFPTCHLKDMDAAGDFADVGDGTIDFPAFVRAAKASGTEYYFVERDSPPEPMRTARQSHAYLAQMTY